MKRILFLFTLLYSFETIAQEECQFTVDTMYFIDLYYSNAPKKRPQNGYVYIKEISKYKISFTTYNDMVNSFYRGSFFASEWLDEFLFILPKCYKDSSQEMKDNLVSEIYNKTIGLQKKYKFKSDKIFITDSTFAIITVYKMIAEFGKFPISEKSFSTVDLHYDFKSYQYDYFYRLRRIINFCTFNEEEKIAIRRIWR